MLRELAKSIREFKRPSILAPVLVSCEVMLECIIPFIVARLVNQIKGGCSIDVILWHGLVLVVMAGLSLTFGWLAGTACSKASSGFARNLRRDLFSKIQTYSFENIDKFSTSSLVTRLTTDVTNVQMAYMMIIRTAIRCPLMLVFAFVMAFVMGGRMAFIFLIVAPILGFGLFAVIRKVMPLFKKVFHKYDVLNNSIQENIKGIRVVKSFVREDYEKEKFSAAAEDVCADFTRAGENPGYQQSAYAVLPLYRHGVRALLRLLYHHHQPGPRPRRGAVFLPSDLQLPDPQQPDDGFHGVCHDYDGERVGQADRGGAAGGKRARQPSGRCHRGVGRFGGF